MPLQRMRHEPLGFYVDFLEGNEEHSLNVSPLECCGWIELSKFGRMYKKHRHDQLIAITTGDPKFRIQSPWSEVCGKKIIPVFLVTLIEGPMVNAWEKHLFEQGFTLNGKFLNPNTNNVVRHYTFVPKESQVVEDLETSTV